MNGEDRDRPYSITNYYELSITRYQRDVAVHIPLLDDQTNDDAQTTPLNKAVGINIRIQDGSRAAFVAKEVTLGAWELNQGGRPDAVLPSSMFAFRSALWSACITVAYRRLRRGQDLQRASHRVDRHPQRERIAPLDRL